MFELDHDLAQDIVDRAMAILPYNVNVMDSQGQWRAGAYQHPT